MTRGNPKPHSNVLCHPNSNLKVAKPKTLILYYVILNYVECELYCMITDVVLCCIMSNSIIILYFIRLYHIIYCIVIYITLNLPLAFQVKQCWCRPLSLSSTRDASWDSSGVPSPVNLNIITPNLFQPIPHLIVFLWKTNIQCQLNFANI